MITLINSAVLTAFGRFEYRPLSLDAARQRVHEGAYRSAIGHGASAQALGLLLGIDCAVNRIALTQQPGEQYLVFRLLGRLAEGEVLRDVQDVLARGYELGLLSMESI